MLSHAHLPNQKMCHIAVAEKPPFLNAFKETWANYNPLIIIIIFCTVISLVRTDFVAHQLVYSFMGHFFIFLSLFKFFDLKGFVDGFSTYDLMSKRLRAYGYAYPFIEFSLGIAYLAKHNPFLINWVTVIVMTVSGIGVLKSVLSGQKLKCACLGTVLNVPLSTVSILENFGMGAMAVYELISF